MIIQDLDSSIGVPPVLGQGTCAHVIFAARYRVHPADRGDEKPDAPLRTRRSAVSSRVVQVDPNELFEVQLHPKEPLELEKLHGTLYLNPLFSQLDEEVLQLFIYTYIHIYIYTY